jgi:hypothetical protein
MPVKKKEEQGPISRPATSPEAREQQLVNLAITLAEKQLRDGTASPSVINHFLKLASQRERLEREILERQSTLIDAKAKHINKERESEEIGKAAIDAMKRYSPGQQ